MGNPNLKWTQGDPFTLEPWPVNEDFFHLIKDHRTNHISSSVLHLIRKKLISLLKVLMDKIVSPPKLWDSDHGIFIVTPISSHLLVVFLRLNILQLGKINHSQMEKMEMIPYPMTSFAVLHFQKSRSWDHRRHDEFATILNTPISVWKNFEVWNSRILV